MSAVAASTVAITTSAGRPLGPCALGLGCDLTFARGVGVGDALATAGRRTATGFPCASTAMRTQASPAGCPDRQGQCRVVRQGTDVLPGNREEGGCRRDCAGTAGSCVPSRTIDESGGGAGLNAVTRPQTAMRGASATAGEDDTVSVAKANARIVKRRSPTRVGVDE